MAEEKKPEKPGEAEEVLEAVEGAQPPVGFLRRPAEPTPEGGLRPLEPLEPMSDADYAERVGDALEPSRIMPPLLPGADLVEPAAGLGAAPRMGRGGRQALQFQCPYGLGGVCCGCRFMPCNELTLAVLGHVTRDYGPGGRCSAGD